MCVCVCVCASEKAIQRKRHQSNNFMVYDEQERGRASGVGDIKLTIVRVSVAYALSTSFAHNKDTSWIISCYDYGIWAFGLAWVGLAWLGSTWLGISLWNGYFTHTHSYIYARIQHMIYGYVQMHSKALFEFTMQLAGAWPDDVITICLWCYLKFSDAFMQSNVFIYCVVCVVSSYSIICQRNNHLDAISFCVCVCVLCVYCTQVYSLISRAFSSFCVEQFSAELFANIY